MLLLAILTSTVLRKKENSLFTYTLFRGLRCCWSSPSGVQSVVQGCYIPYLSFLLWKEVWGG